MAETRPTGSRKTRVLARVARKSPVFLAIFAAELAVTAFVLVAVRTIQAGGLSAATAAVQITGSGTAPDLVFACCETAAVAKSDSPMIANPDVISNLRDLHAGVAVALTDLSADRAQVVRELNDAGIPVTAWLLLPPDEGYYFNAANAREAAPLFSDFERWTAEYHLRWTAVGLDLEPSVQELATLRQASWWRAGAALIRRYFDAESVRRANAAYGRLIRNIQARHYTVQTYQLPLIAAERAAHTTLLERLLGLVDVRGDVEVLMLYTSFAGKVGSALIWRFGPEAQAIAIGVAGGPSGLDWERFSRDALVAGHFSRLVGVYDLEGCVRQGFLPRLNAMKWDRVVTIPAPAVRRAILLHALLPAALETISNLPYWGGGLILLDIAVVWWKKRRRAPPSGSPI